MILYLDTSALVKLFVNEPHSDSVRQWADSASLVMVSQIAWVEFFAAIALKRRTGQLSSDLVPRALDLLRAEWPRYQRIGTDAALFAEAGDLAVEHDLRAYDGVQLASARRAWSAIGAPLRLCAFDKALNRAAASLRIPTLSPEPES